MPGELELQIKNPSKLDGDFKIRVPEAATVGDVKAKLQAEYPGGPQPGSITIIYAGRVLKQDDAPLATFLQQNVDPSSLHTLHIVIKPSATAAASSPAPAAAPPPTVPTSQPPLASTSTSQPAQQQQQQQPAPAAQATEAAPSFAAPAAVPAASEPAAGAARESSTQASLPPSVSAPVQGFAYTIPSPYAIYNPALSAAYTAALQALQAATPPAPVVPPTSQAPVAPAGEGPLAAYAAALQTLAGQQAAPATAGAGTGPSAVPASASEQGPPAGEGPAAGAQPAAAAAAAAAGLAPGAGLVGMPPIALPLAHVAYVPAFIPVPQPVLTAIPNPQFAGAGVMAGVAAAPAGGEHQHQHAGHPGGIQGLAPGGMAGQFFPMGGMGVFPGVAGVGPAGVPQPGGMQVHVVEAVPGEGVRRRRVDVNQPGAVPAEVVEALRAAQQRGQLPGNLAAMVAQLQRQQAERRAARRGGGGRGFQVQINLGRINMRAIMQLLFMVIIMAPYFSMKRLVMMLAVAALLNLARLEAVRRVLNRMAGQLDLPLQHEARAPAAAAAAGAPGGAAPVGQQQQQQRQPEEAGGEGGAAAGAPGAEGAGVAPGERGPQGGEAVGAAAAAPAAGAAAPQPRRQGILQEIQALVVGFITSLLPGFNVNPEDAAAFAAAQEFEAQEQAAAAARGQ